MIKTTLDNLIETNIVVNRKTPKGFDLFQRLEFVVKAPVNALDTDIKHGNSDRISKTRQVFFSYSEDWNWWKVNYRCKDADRQGIYNRSEWNYSSQMHKHRYDKTAQR